MSRNRRIQPRLHADTIRVWLNKDEHSIECLLVDLSEGGCACRVLIDGDYDWQPAIVIGNVLALRLAAPFGQLTLHAMVRWLRHEGPRALQVGLMFLFSGSQQEAAVQNFLLETATRKLRPKAGAAGIAEHPTPSPESVPASEATPQRSGTGLFSPVPPAVERPRAPVTAERARAGTASQPQSPARAGDVLSAADGPRRYMPAPPVRPLPRDTSGTRMLKTTSVTDLLVQAGKLTAAQARDAEQQARANNERVEHWLIAHERVEPGALCLALGEQTRLTVIGLDEITMAAAGMEGLFPRSFAEEHFIVPFGREPGVVFVSGAYALPEAVLGELRHRCGTRIELFLSPYDQIRKAWDRVWPSGGVRASHSYDALLPVSYSFCDERGPQASQQMYMGLLVAISAAGCVVEGNPEPQSAGGLLAGKRLMALTLAEHGAPAQCLCQVTSIQPASDPQRSRFTLALYPEDAEGAKNLERVYMRAAIARLAKKQR